MITNHVLQYRVDQLFKKIDTVKGPNLEYLLITILALNSSSVMLQNPSSLTYIKNFQAGELTKLCFTIISREIRPLVATYPTSIPYTNMLYRMQSQALLLISAQLLGTPFLKW